VPQVLLKPESGAEFFGKVERLDEDRLFRASCYAQLRQNAIVESDSPKFWMCATQAAAEKWTEVQAAERGFSKYIVLSEVRPAYRRPFSDHLEAPTRPR
jgi:hypothetical protein